MIFGNRYIGVNAVIVFVEDEEAVPVFEFWAKKFGFRLKIQFLDSEGACTLSYYANLRVAVSKLVHTLVFAVFGKAQEQLEKEALQGRITRQLELPPTQVFLLDTGETEAFLLSKGYFSGFPGHFPLRSGIKDPVGSCPDSAVRKESAR